MLLLIVDESEGMVYLVRSGYIPRYFYETKTIMLIGTTEGNFTIWCNSTDPMGIIFSMTVIMIFIYTAVYIILFTALRLMSYILGVITAIILLMAFWSYLKSMLTDPGSVPVNAKPIHSDNDNLIAVCGICEGFKPPYAHHGSPQYIFF